VRAFGTCASIPLTDASNRSSSASDGDTSLCNTKMRGFSCRATGNVQARALGRGRPAYASASTRRGARARRQPQGPCWAPTTAA